MIEYRSTNTTTTTYVEYPKGRHISGRVKVIEALGSVSDCEEHDWHEMLHYGSPGTGYAMCRSCGAVGVDYFDGYGECGS